MPKASPDAPTVTPETSPSRRVLLVFAGAQATEHALPGEGALTIGRATECDVRIEQASVSRRHARITIGDVLRIENLGSTSTTRVDGRPLAAGAPALLEPGALVEIGSARLVVKRELATSPMARVQKLVHVVAPGTISVILLGETGVGKEVLAEAIHARSPRAEGPFLRLNCAALPEALLESELFGYERGAFTGALQTKPGLLEAAHTGTAFLDEIGEMPAQTQAKLLRALETREITRVGSVKPRSVDVRFIAATNRDLPALVSAGTFREDLYFRLNGITISIPPLRDRLDEVPDLARHFTRSSIDPGAMLLLSSYRWPGNIRELRNVLERATLLARGAPIGLEHLLLGDQAEAPPSSATPGANERNAPTSPATAATVPPPAVEATGVDPERERILAALERSGGNQKEAARALGMTRRMLMYRMDRLGLPRPRKGSGGGER